MEERGRAQQHERELVLSEYGTWRLTADEDAPVIDEVRTLETLLRLKAEHLRSPDPGLWTEELLTALLTEVVPRVVVQPREQVMDLVPTLRRFTDYLRETGRWHPESISASSASPALAELEFAALEAADDPTRRSFSTNILGYGMSLGVDLEDETELAAYMHWYNSLGDEERLRLSETGRLAEPVRPYDRHAALTSVRAQEEARSTRPWFLPAGSFVPETPLRLEREVGPEDYAGIGIVRCASALLDHLWAPRRCTATEALGRADTAAVLAACGIPRAVRSMWDQPEIVGAWVALRDGGWIEVVDGTAQRCAGPVPYAARDEAPEAFAEFGHAVLTALLLGRDARGPEDGGFRGMPDTATALAAACGEDGVVLTDPVDASAQVREDSEQIERWMRVRHDLEDLVAAGALRQEHGRFRGSPALLIALMALLRERD